jgi:hypothetical protein
MLMFDDADDRHADLLEHLEPLCASVSAILRRRDDHGR